MSITTLDLKEIGTKSASVYEAVLIISKRARAITAERKSREVLYEGTFETTEDLGEPEEEIILQENPIVVAMENFFDNKLEVIYKNEHNEDEVSEDEKALHKL